jgi:hypothetical protein
VKTQIWQGHGRGVESFVQRHREKVTGVVSGWDRLRLQGTLRGLYQPEIMAQYLWGAQVRWKDFKGHVREVTGHIRGEAERHAREAQRPMIYLRSSGVRKEELIAGLRQKDGIDEGLIAVLSAVEPCRTWFARGDRQARKLRLELGWGKCIHLYFYFIHPVFGQMHLRLQTWFPFLIQFCLNGREWLARQMSAEGLGFTREDNGFSSLENVRRAQELLDQQHRQQWQRPLDAMVEQYHPTHRLIHAILPVDYYWTAAETELATDVMFQDRASLERIYPALVHHSVMAFGAEQVLGFLGRKQAGNSEVKTDRRRREPGVRVKHWVDENSQKMYNKGASLRVETTINNPDAFKVYRPSEREPQGEKDWRPLRRTVADLPRRAQVSRAACERHLEALAAVECTTPLGETVAPICRAITRKGRRYRALRPMDEFDQAVLRAINRIEFTLHGLRNRDLQAALRDVLPAALTPKQRSARIGRTLQLLRAHGLLAKISHTQRYRVTSKAREVATAVLAAAAASTPQLTRLAA